MYAKYKNMPCVGGFVDGGISKLKEGTRNIHAGRDANWGSKRIAVFQTSDTRSSTHDELGKWSTWVKWAEPTAEALRQACLAQESRISHQAPELPSATITEVTVKNSQFLGPVNLVMNPQYSALIGGRGTGKSTLLEYLRWALCDQPPEIPTELGAEVPNYVARRQTLIQKTLVPLNATVDVRFVANGLPHHVRRQSSTGETLLRIGDEEFRDCSEADIRALLPVQAFSQKQLSNVAIRIEELARFVEAPIREKLAKSDAELEKIAEAIREILVHVEKARSLGRYIARDELAVQSLTKQVRTIRESFKNLTPDDQATIESKQPHDDAAAIVDVWDADLSGTQEALGALNDALESLPTKPEEAIGDLPGSEDLATIERAMTALYEQLRTDLQEMTTRFEEARDGSISAAKQHWSETKEAFEKRYEEAKKRASAHETQLNELSKLEKRLAETRRTLQEHKQELQELGDPVGAYGELRKSWKDIHKRRTKLLKDQCKALTEASQRTIRAGLEEGAGFSSIAEKLRTAVAGARLGRAKVDALTERIQKVKDPLEEWEAVLAELELLALHDAEEATELPETPKLKLLEWTEPERKRIAAKLTISAWRELAVTPFEDRPAFEYKVREDEHIPFVDASAGQQATALLKTLLNQEGPPLIIDQPEDDLDNQVVLDVVEQVWKAKRRRQLIFASHNANLVVNGDAELVACFGYRQSGDHSMGRIAGTGAIDVNEIRGRITQVMEGGEKAFILRKDKYGF